MPTRPLSALHQPPVQRPPRATGQDIVIDDPKAAVAAGTRVTWYRNRGALSNPDHRFSRTQRVPLDESIDIGDTQVEARLVTHQQAETAKSIINYNNSPDVGFSSSINPYRGCEHGCVYCFARPSHEYLDLSCGLDFETQLSYKQNAVELLKKEWSRPGYQAQTIALGINTDAYQPMEQEKMITRELLELFLEYKHPVSLLTKSTLVLRDLDILQDLAKNNLVSVAVSMTSLDDQVKRTLEPRAASAKARLKTLDILSQHQIPTGVMVAPVIPIVTDSELEAILKAAYDAGARRAGYVLLRLPHQVKQLFREWLSVHYPFSAKHVMNIIQESFDGKDYQAEFGTRMTGKGVFAQAIAERFRLTTKRLGYEKLGRSTLATHLFTTSHQTVRDKNKPASAVTKAASCDVSFADLEVNSDLSFSPARKSHRSDQQMQSVKSNSGQKETAASGESDQLQQLALF